MLLLLLLSRFSRVWLCDPIDPTRLRHPWDSPGKNTGVGCHFLLQCTKVKSESEAAQSCPTLRDPMDCSPPGSSVHGISQARVLEWVAIANILIFIFIFKTNLGISDYLLMYNTSNILAVSVKREDILIWLHLCENHNFEIGFSQSLFSLYMFHINFLISFYLLFFFSVNNIEQLELWHYYKLAVFFDQ